MALDPDPPSVDILYIGRADTYYDGVWRELKREGFAVAFARTQAMGLKMAWDLEPRIVVINITNSQFSGDSLCKTVGRRLPGAHRLVIAERGIGDALPCEHRLVRPFTPRKFHQSLLQLLQAASPNHLRGGDVQLDLVARVVIGPNGQQRLTPKECDLLADLMRRPNQVISRKELMEHVWKTRYLGDTRTLDVHVRWLREKIEPDPRHPVYILTRRGIGYLMAIPAPKDDLAGDLEDDEMLLG